MSDYLPISFENTEFAFQYKSDKEIRKARFLFSSMGKPWLVRMGTRLTPKLIRWGLPIKGIIRNTIFSQFCGGETLEQTSAVAKKLGEYNVQIILDYAVEGGESSDAEYDKAIVEFLRVIRYAATQPNIPYVSIKVTGIADSDLLEKLDTLMKKGSGSLMSRYFAALEQVSPAEKEAWHRVQHRLMQMCNEAKTQGVGVQVDAEQSWFLDPVDALTMLMMDMFNKEKPVVYNTLQMYRHDRMAFLKDCYDAAVERNFFLAIKFVRGAYMERERRRAAERGYPSPINPDKESTDRDFDAAIAFCIDHIDRCAMIVASHNEKSNLLAAELLKAKGLPYKHPHVHWSQLFGMSDNITFNLAHAGCNVSKYLPFGPIKDVIPYLMRRAQENTSVKGQTGRELALIQKEVTRRKAAGH